MDPLMPPDAVSLSRRCVAEALGTGFLVAAVVGSGIMAQRLAGGDGAIALLANTMATGAVLVALILGLGGVSGAHFNPAVTLFRVVLGEQRRADLLPYLLAQLAGGLVGVLAAHGMFELPLVSLSRHPRQGPAQLLGEAIATFGLLLVIRGCDRFRPELTAFAVAAYIASGYWFTASTSFANPAVTLARGLTDSFSGIRPRDVPGFIAAQVLAAAAAAVVSRWLLPRRGPDQLHPSETS